MLIFLLILTYSAEMGALGHTDFTHWLETNVYSLPRVTELLDKHDSNALLTLGYCTNFASFHILQMAFNCYFFWVFSKHVEQKVGPLLYIVLLTAGTTIPLIVLHWDMGQSHNARGFIGPLFLLCAFIGAYMVFPPLPKSRMAQQAGVPKGQIFRRGGRPDPLDKYVGNPWMFVLTFTVIQVLFHYWLTTGIWIIHPPVEGYDNLAIYPILVALAIGYSVAAMLQAQAMSSLKDGPMTLQALKTYRQLLDLDVSHDDAIKGTARALGLPQDKVKQWVAKNKHNLRVK